MQVEPIVDGSQQIDQFLAGLSLGRRGDSVATLLRDKLD